MCLLSRRRSTSPLVFFISLIRQAGLALTRHSLILITPLVSPIINSNSVHPSHLFTYSNPLSRVTLPPLFACEVQMSTQPPNSQSMSRPNVAMAVAQSKPKSASKASNANAAKSKMQMHRRSRTGSFTIHLFNYSIFVVVDLFA